PTPPQLSDVGSERNRRLAAVWFADIVGYTRLSSQDEDAALAVVDELQALSYEAVDGKGRVVKFLGDAALAVFDSTNAALESAIALQRAFAESETVQSHACSLSVGVHVGEVVESEDGDIYGDGVNMASRIEGVASAGQVVISEDVYRQIRNRPTYNAQSIGEHELKGVEKPATLFVVALAGQKPLVTPVQAEKRAAAALASAPAKPPTVSHRKSVAVGASVSVVGFLFLAMFVASSVGSRDESPEGGDSDTPAAVASDEEATRPDGVEGTQSSQADAGDQRLAETGKTTGDRVEDAATAPVQTRQPAASGGRAPAKAGSVDDDPVGTAPSTGLVVIVYGDDEPAVRQVEASLLRSLGTRREVTPMDASSLALIRGDEPAVRAALQGDFLALVELGRTQRAEFMIVGDLRSSARPGAGPMYSGSAQLDLTMYRVSTGELVESGVFRVGMGGEPGRVGTSEFDARTQAADEAGKQGAAAARRWLVRALR
ncbi:MAG: adenylate/guanylate cyclase domain-containing protein, partial [Longimicrobiales bacterium]